jgi:hypothetical protein
VAVAAVVLGDHRSAGQVIGGEQAGGAVPDVVVGAALGCRGQHGQARGGAVQGLYLGLLVDCQDQGVLRRGTSLRPGHSRTFPHPTTTARPVQGPASRPLTAGQAAGDRAHLRLALRLPHAPGRPAYPRPPGAGPAMPALPRSLRGTSRTQRRQSRLLLTPRTKRNRYERLADWM